MPHATISAISEEPASRTPDTRRRISKAAAVILLVILTAGLGLRLFRLGFQSAWYDEAGSLLTSNLPFGAMTAELVADFVHPPLHYYLVHGVFRTLGFGGVQARLVSVVFGA